jgi:xanthine dehydrogenase molybdopterin-binding subunit B
VRYTAIQDAGRAIHPSYVEGQYQGGVAQGIGWALNEEYIYGAEGRLQNAGFLDYRVPVASDLPMIDTVIVEVPNPRHPYGVRGVGETPIARRWLPSPTPSATPLACASLTCRCRHRRCWPRSTSPRRGKRRRSDLSLSHT